MKLKVNTSPRLRNWPGHVGICLLTLSDPFFGWPLDLEKLDWTLRLDGERSNKALRKCIAKFNPLSVMCARN